MSPWKSFRKWEAILDGKSADYREGFEACMNAKPFSLAKSQEWQEGWLDARRLLDH